jgi:selenocysteine lyase/cysteine desulfurase
MREVFLLDPEVAYFNRGGYGAFTVEVFDEYQRWHRVEVPVYEWEDTTLLRVSVGPYNDKADVKRLSNALRSVL